MELSCRYIWGESGGTLGAQLSRIYMGRESGRTLGAQLSNIYGEELVVSICRFCRSLCISRKERKEERKESGLRI